MPAGISPSGVIANVYLEGLVPVAKFAGVTVNELIVLPVKIPFAIVYVPISFKLPSALVVFTSIGASPMIFPGFLIELTVKLKVPFGIIVESAIFVIVILFVPADELHT